MDCQPPQPTMTCIQSQIDGTEYISCSTDRDGYLLEVDYTRSLLQNTLVIDGVMFATNKQTNVKKINHKQVSRVPINYKVDPEFHSDDICVVGHVLIITNSVLVSGVKTEAKEFVWNVPLTPAADINNDGIIDGEDLGIVYADWGTSVFRSDLNRDGKVDGSDLGLIIIAWTG